MYRARRISAKASRNCLTPFGRGSVPRGKGRRRLVYEALEDRRLLSIGAEGGATQTLAASSGVETVWFEDVTPSLESGFYSGTPTLELAEASVAGICGRLSVPGVLYETVGAESSDFLRLQVPGWGTVGEVGRPELPAFRCSLAIPADVEVTAEITAGGEVSLIAADPIYPVQPLEPDDGSGEETFAYDTAFYAGGDGSDGQLFRMSEPMAAGDQRSIALEFYPFQYDPASGRITVVTDFQFNLVFQEDTAAQEAAPFDADLTSTAGLADYLIVTADAYYEEVLPLAEWKYKQGYKTYVARMSEVGTTQQDVYNYLKAAYDADSVKPRYVLLVGDHEQIPSDAIDGHPYYSDPYTWYADYDYARLSGTDVLADVALGRLPGDTEAQITTMVNKILAYECTPDISGRYDDVLLAGQFQDSDDGIHDLVEDRFFMEDLHRITDFLSGDYDFWADPDPYDKGFTVYTNRVWDSATSETLHYRVSSYPGRIIGPDPVPDAWKFKSDAAIATTINNGVGIVLHRDHGSSSGWGSPSFSTSNVNALTNGVRLPVVFSLNCGTGQFDGIDAFAEAWMRNANGGAVAMTGAARVSYSGPNDSLHVGIFDSMWTDYDTTWQSANYQPSWHFGQLMNYAKDRVFSGYGYSDTYALLTARLFNVFGDPEMMIRTKTPATLDVSHPLTVVAGSPTNVTVQVTQGGLPMAGAMVAISNGVDHWVSLVNAAGYCNFYNLTFSGVGTYDVVVSERNSIPYQGTLVSLAVSGADLSGAQFDVSPDNLLLGAGTTVAAFSLLNYGSAAAGAFDVQFYLSDDAHIDPATDILLLLHPSDSHYDASEPAAYHVSGLGSMATDVGAVTLVVPTDDPFDTDNDYYLGMFVDADADVAETDEANNSSLGQGLDCDNVDFTLGPLDHFTWDVISSPQHADVPFSVTITAADSNGLTVTDFDDSVTLTGWVGETDEVYFSDFESDGGGWVASATWQPGDWEWGVPTSGPNKAYSGQNVWATNLEGNYTNVNPSGSSYLKQTFDFTGRTGVTLSWRQWVYLRYFDDAKVYVNGDLVYSRGNNLQTPDYEEVTVDLAAYDNLGSVEITFELYANNSLNRPGWYIDDVTITSDAASVPITPTVTGSFVDGVWTGQLTVLAAADDVCLRVDDGNGHAAVSNTFDVGDENLTPTDISLVPDNVDENALAGAVVGTLSTTDPVPGETFSYALVAGEGDDDNGLFTIEGDQVKTAAVFNYEMQNLFSIRVEATDSGGLTYEEALLIAVNDVPESLIPGDANGDGTVNEADAQVVSAHWGAGPEAEWRMGDFNGDGRVNAVDAAIMTANWGTSVGPEEGEPDVPLAPEPPAVPLIGPLLAERLSVARRLIEPACRAAAAVPALVEVPSDKSTSFLSEQAAVACDVALAAEYGPPPADLARQHLAWRHTAARRSRQLGVFCATLSDPQFQTEPVRCATQRSRTNFLARTR